MIDVMIFIYIYILICIMIDYNNMIMTWIIQVFENYAARLSVRVTEVRWRKSSNWFRAWDAPSSAQ